MITRITFFVFCAAVLVSGCAKKDAGAGGMGNATADSMKTAYKAVSDAWDAGKVDEFGKYVAENAVDHNPMPGQAQGLAGMKKMATDLHTAYPDMKSTIEDLRVDGDMLTVRFTMRGTNSGPMMGMPPTNKKVEVMGIDQVRWQNGKFVEHWGLIDVPTMMQQLGMMPPPGAGMPPPDAGKAMGNDMGKEKMPSKKK
jgi:predicted ester cyclase